MLLRFNDIFVTGDPKPLRGPGSVAKAWMPPSCRLSSMNGTSTPYDLVRAVPEWLESAYRAGQRHPRCWWLLLLTLIPARAFGVLGYLPLQDLRVSVAVPLGVEQHEVAAGSAFDAYREGQVPLLIIP